MPDDCWEGVLEFRHSETGTVHRWWHPIADGATEPADWEKKQVVIDQTYVRALLPAGRYECYWALCPVSLKSDPINPEPLAEMEPVKIGNINVQPISMFAALKGGKLGVRVTPMRLLLLAAAIAAAGVAGAVVASLHQRRRRR